MYNFGPIYPFEYKMYFFKNLNKIMQKPNCKAEIRKSLLTFMDFSTTPVPIDFNYFAGNISD